jgi:DNA-binding IclR family transcriptional regulator
VTTTFLRGLEVLEALAGMRQPASLRAVARRTGLSESQAFRVLRELEQGGYLEHLGRTGYRLGSRSVALSTLIGPRPALLRAVQPALARLAVTTHEAVVLHLRSGADRVLALGVPAPTGPIREPAGVLGERSPLAVGASGRVILAHLSEAEIAASDPDGLAGPRLARIRELGYDTSYGENHPGINGISAPLLADADAYTGAAAGPGGTGDASAAGHTALGSITIAGPAARLPESVIVPLARPLVRACQDLSPRLAAILGPSPGATLEALDL